MVSVCHLSLNSLSHKPSSTTVNITCQKEHSTTVPMDNVVLCCVLMHSTRIMYPSLHGACSVCSHSELSVVPLLTTLRCLIKMINCFLLFQYMGSFPVAGPDQASRTEYMRTQLQQMRVSAA